MKRRKQTIMKIDIQPQDRRQPEAVEFALHPDLIRRLNEYAQSLDGSDVSYVLSQILEQVLPSEKPARRAKGDRTEKLDKEAPKKAAA
ncbi:MAG: hypothetical protein JOY95_06455 [Silvibacterium sp.]|nr:hypothetical protein [Silvibacterium sp.]